MNGPFELLLFVATPGMARAADDAGIDGLVIDWESRGKAERQTGYDTQINRQTPDDLRAVRAVTQLPIVCRLNPYGPWTPGEVEQAVIDGADEIMLPMVRGRDDVARTLDLASGRVPVGILIETADASCQPQVFSDLPLSRVYVGLHDLAIERGSTNPFEAVADGTVERVRDACTMAFGFGGLTLPDRGTPIPCRLLMAEMARLGCRFSFLRRSFLRDVPPEKFEEGVRAIRAALATAGADGASDRRALVEAIMRWEQGPCAAGR